MDSHILSVAPPRSVPPLPVADLRPTADTAALVRDPTPEVPMPMPASIAQKGVVARTGLASALDAAAKVQRVLKPYGVTMLPHARPDDPPARSGDAAGRGDGDAAAINVAASASRADDPLQTALTDGTADVAVPDDDSPVRVPADDPRIPARPFDA